MNADILANQTVSNALRPKASPVGASGYVNRGSWFGWYRRKVPQAPPLFPIPHSVASDWGLIPLHLISLF